jgi:hypothetical protein
MKLQYLTASACVLLGLASLACSSGDDDIFMGGDGAGGSSAGTNDPGVAGTGSSTAGSKNGGTGSGGGSSSAGTGSGGDDPGGGTGSGGGSSAGTGSGGTSGGYEPCAGKACGDVCTPCDPSDPNCFALTVEMTCTATGQCSVGRPACTIPMCEGDQKYHAPGCGGEVQPNPGTLKPFEAGCYDACSSAGSCPDGFTCTSVWNDPSASCEPAGEACPGVCGAVASICIAG